MFGVSHLTVAICLYIFDGQNLGVDKALVADNTIGKHLIIPGVIGARAAGWSCFPQSQGMRAMVFVVGQEIVQPEARDFLPELFFGKKLRNAAKGITDGVSDHAAKYSRVSV